MKYIKLFNFLYNKMIKVINFILMLIIIIFLINTNYKKY